MSLVSPVVDPIREFFGQRRAEGAIRAYAPQQGALVRRHAAAAGRRARAGRGVTDPVAGAILLREAVVESMRAIGAARVAPSTVDTADANPAGGDDRDRLAATMPTLAPDPVRPRADPSDDARVRDAIAARDPLYFDALSPEDAERTRWALDRASSMLRGRVEARTLANVRGTRWGRIGAILVIVAYAAMQVARATLLPKDIALGKPVMVSSRAPSSPDPQGLVDGELGTSVGVHTNTEDNPTVVIDLQDAYWLDEVRVYNRLDGWYDDCLPLVVEVSDGKGWEEIGRREEHFGTSPPWIINAGGRRAREVRLRVARKSYIALSEVEVYGKKEKK